MENVKMLNKKSTAGGSADLTQQPTDAQKGACQETQLFVRIL